MSSKIKHLCQRLDSLARGKPNAAARSEVLEALKSKWEGVQVHAARALAAWADDESVQALRAWLEESRSKEAGWAVRGEAVKCLCSCTGPRDASWMLELYFSTEDRLVRHELLPLIDAVPVTAARERIEIEAKSSEPLRRDAATIARRRLSWRLDE